MTDILFISPRMDNDFSSESVGTLLLATILRNNGLNTKIIPLVRFGLADGFTAFLNNATNIISQEQPKIVSFYTRCDNYHLVLKLAEQLKQHLQAYIVFGGPQADITAYQTISNMPYVDYICCGEGENTVYPFFLSLLKGMPDLSVPGLVYRHDGKTVANPRPELIQDLDSLPNIDYSLYHSDKAMDLSNPFQIDVGRGCPFGCTYCSTKIFWGRKYRLKSPQRIVAEIKDAHEQFGVSYFLFDHDMFTMNRAKVTETCKLIKQLNFPITWRCSARLDCIDKDLIDTMVDAGMVGIFLGIETGSARMQKSINKKLNLDNALELLSYIDSKGCKVTTSFIFGFPEESEEDISQTIALLAECIKLKHLKPALHLCTFLPGTEMTLKYLSSLTPADNYSNISGSYALEECKDMIDAHPSIFSQFWEYKTQLRDKLRYFVHFIQTWTLLQPVYQYISEKYPSNRLVEMYYDFVRQNADILFHTKDLPWQEQIQALITADHLPELFKDDPRYDIMIDFYKMHNIRSLINLGQINQATDIYCFSPADIQSKACLQEYVRRRCIVTHSRGIDQTTKMVIRVLK